MANVKLGNQTFEGVESVKLNTTDGGTATFTLGGGVTGEFVLCGEATEVGESAFYTEKINGIYLPNATNIGNSAFEYNYVLSSINLPNATNIGDDAFHSCDALVNVDIPNATNIGDRAFHSCTSLTSVDLPNATNIGDYAFHSCTSLTSVDLPNATNIGDRAFNGCTSLASVDLPNATSIGESAFYGCANLSSLILRTTESVCQLIVTAALGTKIVTAEGVPTGEGFIYVPAKFYEDYVTLIAYQAAMLLVSQGMGEAEAQATADYIARAILRKIEDYPEICG